MVLFRRLLVLVLVVGATAAGFVVWQRRRDEPGSTVPEWPPFPVDPQAPRAASDAPGAPAAPETPSVPETSDTSVAEWVEPIDGACPDGYPVKLNLTSGIFHVPGGRSYERTNPDRCYRSAEAATADGYRAAKA